MKYFRIVLFIATFLGMVYIWVIGEAMEFTDRSDVVSKYESLVNSGVINKNELVEFRKETNAGFNPDDSLSIAKWLMPSAIDRIQLPAAMLLLLNLIYMILAERKEKASNNALDRKG